MLSVLAGTNNVMMGLCQTLVLDHCLHLMIESNALHFGFWNDDCQGTTTVVTNRWSHFAFVYDYTALTQYIYLNGNIECTHTSAGPFIANSGTITIGGLQESTNSTPLYFWTGYIDQLSFVASAKSAAEVLSDATLVAYYSFDGGSLSDSGPNGINAVR